MGLDEEFRDCTTCSCSQNLHNSPRLILLGVHVTLAPVPFFFPLFLSRKQNYLRRSRGREETRNVDTRLSRTLPRDEETDEPSRKLETREGLIFYIPVNSTVNICYLRKVQPCGIYEGEEEGHSFS